jgi:snurportin-1
LTLGADGEDSDDAEVTREGVGGLVSLLEPLPSSTPSTSKQSRKHKQSKYAEKCMYAELLELGGDSDKLRTNALPPDLQVKWIALSPVPKGKRCLAVAHMSHGNPGSGQIILKLVVSPLMYAAVPTVLHSRLKGKVLLAFPSPLPPDTILDCILDEQWRYSGLLHVLDVVRWHGQSIGDGECSFR